MVPKSSSSLSFTQGYWAYDAFLSFRGEDFCKNFVVDLHTALAKAGIRAFNYVARGIPKGEEILPYLMKAIEGSRISIVVFSEGYTHSTWCLKELVKIMECKHSIGQTFIPVFYENTDHAFYDPYSIYLKQAANLSGCDVKDIARGNGLPFIEKIVKDVKDKLHHRNLTVSNHLSIDTKQILKLKEGSERKKQDMAMDRAPFVLSKSSSLPQSRWLYDVFLSFREDMDQDFPVQLYTALNQAGLKTIRSENKIDEQLMKAVEGSRIAIVVFSRGYGFSSNTRFLGELVKIIECKNTIGQTVIPLCYAINPSDVRIEKFPPGYGVERWSVLLEEVTNISGWHLEDTAFEDRSELIKMIVKDVRKAKERKYSSLAN